VRAISCPSSSSCFAVDAAGRVVVGRRRLPTRTEIRAALQRQIRPHGRAALIGALAQSRIFELPLTAPADGRIEIRWLLRVRRPGSRLRTKTLLVARAASVTSEGQSITLSLRMTSAGLAALVHRRHARVTAKAFFTPRGGRPVVAERSFTLRS
jgi:hypothetical protein